MKTLVVVPTYNERDNLLALAKRIFAVEIQDLSLLIVDDNSPDGTAAYATELAGRYPLRVIRRSQKDGVGKAYSAAFHSILSEPEPPDYIIQMDADLSHDPALIPALLRAMDECDIAIGSRYVASGRIENWGMIRRSISKIGNAYARVLLGLPYRDLTSGYRCFRAGALARLIEKPLSSSRYCFMIETIAKAHALGYQIREIPIVFTERAIGKSKFNLGIIVESVWRVLALALRAREADEIS